MSLFRLDRLALDEGGCVRPSRDSGVLNAGAIDDSGLAPHTGGGSLRATKGGMPSTVFDRHPAASARPVIVQFPERSPDRARPQGVRCQANEVLQRERTSWALPGPSSCSRKPTKESHRADLRGSASLST